ncbi:unnamed protein product [Mucor hiemalis]
MEKDTEKHSKCDDKKIISVGSKPVKRDQSRCCFGLLSLRSGIYVVSVASFIFSLYGLHDGPSTSEEDLDIIRSVPQWANSAFLCLSFCTEATGLYGAYKVNAILYTTYLRYQYVSFLEIRQVYKLLQKVDWPWARFGTSLCIYSIQRRIYEP